MTRKTAWLAALLVALATLSVAPLAWAAPLSDTIPGGPLPASPWTSSLNAATLPRAVCNVTLVAGETLKLSLSTDPAVASMDCDLDLYLYGPGTTAGPVDHTKAIAKAVLPIYYPETITYTAPVSGTYYVEVLAFRGSGPAILTWSVVPEPLIPVYRFYNARSGTHFYTPSYDEKNMVLARWPNVFSFEGVAYETRASKNSQPLYRFYNNRSGSHFYTASLAEKTNVLARWGTVYTFEGETYNVSLTADGGKTPVYRFFNVRNGSHFFTASETEMNTVRARWSGTYTFEGVAFYLGQ